MPSDFASSQTPGSDPSAEGQGQQSSARQRLRSDLAGRSFEEQQAALAGAAVAPQDSPSPAGGGEREDLPDRSTFAALPVESRGGFTYRALEVANRSDNPAQVLPQAEYERPVSRAEAAAILAWVLKLGDKLSGQPAVFSDLPLSHWAAAAVYRCREEGILTGVGENKYRPADLLKPEQARTLLERAQEPKAADRFDREAALAEAEAHRPVGGGATPGEQDEPPLQFTREVYDKHAKLLQDYDLDLADHQWSVNQFQANWERNRTRYEEVARRSGVPAKLVAAIHFRESSGDFGTYLHQGDPLGRPAVHWPTNIPIFHVWEDAAVHALGLKQSIQDDVGLQADSSDMAAMATYAEHYNGLGYHNRGRTSPYVWSGTDNYDRGKYVADGQFDPNTRDRQLGVVAMIRSLEDETPQGTPLEGQILVQGKPARDVAVAVVDEQGKRTAGRTNAKGFFEVPGGLPPGAYAVEVAGQTRQVQVQPGKPAWVQIDLEQLGETPDSSGVPNPAEPADGIDLSPSESVIVDSPSADADQEQDGVRPPYTGPFAGSLLKLGERGKLVRLLQERLNLHGARLSADGIFGRRTNRALWDFQASRGLAVDGVVGVATAAELMAPPRTLGRRMLRWGARGPEVEELQRLLVRLGAAIEVDGDFGHSTAKAVRAFQASKGLLVDGEAGPQTFMKLIAAAEAAHAPKPEGEDTTQTPDGQPDSGDPGTPRPGPDTKPGDNVVAPDTEPDGGPDGEPQTGPQEPTSGTIEVHGIELGPFAGSYQGRTRAAIIQERLAAVDAGALESAELKIQGTAYVIHVGPVQFRVTSADVAANSGVFPEQIDRYKAVAAHYLTQMGAPVPETSLSEDRGAAAAKSAALEFQRGVQQHGAGRTWETWGSNKGPLVNEYKQANRAGGNNNSYEWCGMFVGYQFRQAGIRDEILRNLVFWSGLRLHKFFTSGGYVATSQASAGSWWQPHKTVQIGSATGDSRKSLLNGFGPRPGDVALFRSDYSHVAIVSSYNPETGRLELIEGNRGNRVQATLYDTGDNQVTFLGRFNDSDYEPGGTVAADVANADMPNVTHSTSGGSTH